MSLCFENQLSLETKDKSVVKEHMRKVVLDFLKYDGSEPDRSFNDPNRELYIVAMKKAMPNTNGTAPELGNYRLKVDAAKSRSFKLLEGAFGSEGRDLFCGIYSGYNEFSCLLSEEEAKKIEGIKDEVVSVRPMDLLYYSSSDCSPCASDESDSELEQASDESDLEQANDEFDS